MQRIHVLAIAGIVLLMASSAHAQTAPPPQPLVLEKIPTGFVIAPDFKATEVDHQFGQLAGAYAARVTDDTLLIGGAGYWLVNGSEDFKLAYGGLLLGWNADHRGRVRFGARGLVGAGTATLGRSIDGIARGGRESLIRFGRVQTPPAAFRGAPSPSSIRVRIADEFVVFEPQANLSLHVTERMAITGAAGYRAVAATDVLRDVLDGPTVSLGLQFGW